MEINQHKSVEKDEVTGDVLLSGHEYDDIRELDNNLPKWWVGLFLITIVFSVAYVLIYDILRMAPSQQEEWKTEMAAAGGVSSGQPSPEAAASLVALTDQASLDAGKTIFLNQCKVCHLEGGQGLVGPNLTDNFSIHGCNYADVVNIITIGAPEKGMISWKAQLTGTQIQQVASYIITLRGTNPPNPKVPQGEPCK
ncbi:MAG TPA: cbb3-type cytochrome c oxidase N-terminal domain-containing protein [Bacteroidales bacterium]|nr:cbb3-type cytochrome c oxidase N-terminal domain-containing protein [Bacteroidales bacterium]HPS61739.1 cbb3-type cytochrome c oxidase N-terminal domain-containing protein [Bacteroidales bacterium]